jgi:hypothetical protein
MKLGIRPKNPKLSQAMNYAGRTGGRIAPSNLIGRMVVLKGDIHFIVSSNIRHSQLFSYIPRKT